MVTSSGAGASSWSILLAGATEGRMIDRGNADLRSLDHDFRRVGVSAVGEHLAASSAYWRRSQSRRGDRAFYQDLIELRNALAHGNQRQVDRLRERGIRDTVSWARARLCGLDRTASALDRIVWDNLSEAIGGDPW